MLTGRYAVSNILPSCRNISYRLLSSVAKLLVKSLGSSITASTRKIYSNSQGRGTLLYPIFLVPDGITLTEVRSIFIIKLFPFLPTVFCFPSASESLFAVQASPRILYYQLATFLVCLQISTTTMSL